MFSSSRIVLMLAAACLLAACSPKPEVLSPELSTPALAVEFIAEQAGERRVFFTADALEGLPGTAEEKAERLKRYETVLHDPKAWRALHRQERFDTVLLTGSPAAFKPLLEHLVSAPDWRLAYVDATSVIFCRPPVAEWTPERLTALKERFAKHSRREQSLMRVQVIHRLAAVHRLAEAKAVLDETLKIDPEFAPALTELASWHGTQAQWEDALKAAERAVKADGDYLPAVAAEANALFAHGRFAEALARTRRLVKELPEDGASLYLHAKVTHAARAFQEEIEALRKIIAMAERQGMPTGTWRVYLGQAYGVTGEAEPSIEQFELALKDPTLPERERDFATKAIERIKKREPIL